MEENYVLLVEDPLGMDREEVTARLRDYLSYYVANQNNPRWLHDIMRRDFPNYSETQTNAWADEILTNIRTSDAKLKSLQTALQDGQSRESWLLNDLTGAGTGMSVTEAGRYLTECDQAIVEANEQMRSIIMRQDGSINLNPNLDGFIAEGHHVQTFNLNAQASGSPYRAEMLQSTDKNSVDIVIKDADGTVVKQYQSKYCKDVEATKEAFKKGDYSDQNKLVSSDQKDAIEGASDVIEAPDGTKSNPATKKEMKDVQKKAQDKGVMPDRDWNDYLLKDLAKQVTKNAAMASAQGALIGAGMHIAGKVIEGEPIEGAEVVEEALKSGADFGVKSAIAGALKVAVERDAIKFIAKGTPMSVFTNIAFLAVENAKILGRVASGELSGPEGIDKMEETTISTIAGLAAMGKGMAAGAAVGTILGPIGMGVGCFVGGAMGYMAGTTIGKHIAAGAKEIRQTAGKVVKAGWQAAKSAGRALGNLASKIFG